MYLIVLIVPFLRGLRVTSGLWGNDSALNRFRRGKLGEFGYCDLWVSIRFFNTNIRSLFSIFLDSSFDSHEFCHKRITWILYKKLWENILNLRCWNLFYLLVLFFWLPEESLLEAFHLFKQSIPVQLSILTCQSHWRTCYFRTITQLLLELIY